MPPKKKPQANGFYLYMVEQQNKIKSKTKRAPTMREMPGLCKAPWDDLTPTQRAVYDNRAKQMKYSNRNTDQDLRMDSQRQVISERKDYPVEIEKRRRNETKGMRSDWKGQDLLNMAFHVIDFQVMYNEWREDHRLPLEVGMVRLTLAEGITNYLHRFINPGDAPQGNRHLAIEHAERTHQIPLNFEHGDTNFLSLWMQIEKFVCEDPRRDDFPPIFCLSDNVLDVESSLDYLYARAATGETNRLFKVHCLEDLMSSLIMLSGQMAREPSKTQLQDILKQNRWDYTNSIRCFYHQEVDCAYCSLSIVRRQCFSMFDMLSKPLGFDLTAKHMPDETSAAFSVVHPSAFNRNVIDDDWQPPSRGSDNRSSASSVSSYFAHPRLPSTTKVEIPSTEPQGRFTISLSDESSDDDEDDVDEVLYTDEVKSTSDQYELKPMRLPKTLSIMQQSGQAPEPPRDASLMKPATVTSAGRGFVVWPQQPSSTVRPPPGFGPMAGAGRGILTSSGVGRGMMGAGDIPRLMHTQLRVRPPAAWGPPLGRGSAVGRGLSTPAMRPFD